MVKILRGDCAVSLQQLPDQSANCCVTSPPYWGLRDYGHDGQIGLEESPEIYVQKLAAVFREVRRVLRPDGTLWLNIGDSYNAYNGNRGPSASFQSTTEKALPSLPKGYGLTCKELKNKDLVGIPWRVAFALQADGWYLRQDIIWHKPNPMPESVTDRCTKAHEYLFLLSKSERYYFDAEKIQEKTAFGVAEKRNKRSVWSVNVQPFHGAHFATFPPALIEPCILAGCPDGGTVLDPFGGAGTTGLVANRHNRRAIICELNPDYAQLAEARIRRDAPMFSSVTVE